MFELNGPVSNGYFGLGVLLRLRYCCTQWNKSVVHPAVESQTAQLLGSWWRQVSPAACLPQMPFVFVVCEVASDFLWQNHSNQFCTSGSVRRNWKTRKGTQLGFSAPGTPGNTREHRGRNHGESMCSLDDPCSMRYQTQTKPKWFRIKREGIAVVLKKVLLDPCLSWFYVWWHLVWENEPKFSHNGTAPRYSLIVTTMGTPRTRNFWGLHLSIAATTEVWVLVSSTLKIAWFTTNNRHLWV